jgi:hypothetical protein
LIKVIKTASLHASLGSLLFILVKTSRQSKLWLLIWKVYSTGESNERRQIGMKKGSKDLVHRIIPEKNDLPAHRISNPAMATKNRSSIILYSLLLLCVFITFFLPFDITTKPPTNSSLHDNLER